MPKKTSNSNDKRLEILGVLLFALLEKIGQLDLVIKLSYVFFLGIIGILMSLLMRMQIAWPEKPNIIFKACLVSGPRKA